MMMATYSVGCRHSGGGWQEGNINLRIVLTHITEISYCFYYLATEMDIILVGFSTLLVLLSLSILQNIRQGQSLN